MYEVTGDQHMNLTYYVHLVWIKRIGGASLFIQYCPFFTLARATVVGNP
jgi:hypothetical protein